MASSKENLEVEVKFLIEDLPSLRRRLIGAGAEMKRPRVYERNVRFDTPDNALLQKEELLRLRQDTSATITFKGLSAHDLESEAKVREEIEVGVDDFERMATIFERLGFYPVQTYEKYRETFQWHNVEVVLDELPYGNFVELEGNEADLKAAAASFGLDWPDRILANYLALMALLVERYDLPFVDVTFENFRGRDILFTEILPALS